MAATSARVGIPVRRAAPIAGMLFFLVLGIGFVVFGQAAWWPPSAAAVRQVEADASALSPPSGTISLGRIHAYKVTNVSLGLEYRTDLEFDALVEHFEPQLAALGYRPASTNVLPATIQHGDYCRGDYRASIAYIARQPDSLLINLTWDGTPCR